MINLLANDFVLLFHDIVNFHLLIEELLRSELDCDLILQLRYNNP